MAQNNLHKYLMLRYSLSTHIGLISVMYFTSFLFPVAISASKRLHLHRWSLRNVKPSKAAYINQQEAGGKKKKEKK